KLQFETKLFFFTWRAVLSLVRDAVDRRRIVGVSVSTAPALCDDHPLFRFGEIVERFTGLVVIDHGTDGNRNLEILAVPAMAVAAFAWSSSFGAERMVVPEF